MNELIYNFKNNNSINKYIGKFDHFLATNADFVITDEHVKLLFQNTNCKPFFEIILLKFLNFGYKPSSYIITNIISKSNNLKYCIRVLLKNKKNKKILFDVGQMSFICANISDYYLIWRIIHEKHFIPSTILFDIIKHSYYHESHAIPELIQYKKPTSYCDLINYITNKYNIYPTYNTLLNACKTENIILFDHCTLHGILPTPECLTHILILDYFSVDAVKILILKIHNYKILITNEMILMISNKKMIKLLYELNNAHILSFDIELLVNKN